MDARRDAHEFERLLMHARWLSDLARRLVRDPATADDLVQDTWHAALRQRNERVTSERGWLATLLSNSARVRARSESARRERERSVAASESIEGPDQLVERAEAQRNLLARVLELDEPYRSTVLARYAQGASSAEIARQTHVNESTVRTRLARAHEQLRERIERQGGGLLALAPLCSDATPSPLGGAAGGAEVTAGTFEIGAVIMGLALKIGVVAAVGLCAWLAWRGVTAHDEPLTWTPPLADNVEHDPLQAVLETADSRMAIAAEKAPVPTAAVAPKPAVPPAAVDATQLEICVLRDLVPTAGVRVWIAADDAWPIQYCVDIRPMPLPKSARVVDTNSFGIALFTGLDASIYNYRLGLGTGIAPTIPTRFVTPALFAGHPYEIRLGTASVRGRVFDGTGRLRVGAGVQVYSAKPDVNRFYIAAHTMVDERGEYLIGDLAAGPYHVIMDADGTFDGRGEVQQVQIEIRAGESQNVDFGRSVPAPRWSGHLSNAFHEPLLGIALRLVRETDGRVDRAPIDRTGRFDFAFEPGAWSVFASFDGCPIEGFAFGLIELPEHDIVRDLVVPGARLRVNLIEPLEPSTKSMKDRINSQRVVSIRPKGHDYPAAFRSIGLREDGTRLIDGLEPGEWTLSVHPGTFTEGSTLDVTIGPDQGVVDVQLHWKSQ